MTPAANPSPPGSRALANGREAWGLRADRGLAVGIALGGARDPTGWRQRLEEVAAADALGLHSVWVPEMHFTPEGTASPLTALSAFAACSSRLRLGTTSLLLPIHHPLRVAEETAQLDVLSGGRLILGLGRGFRAPLFDGFGVDPRRKRDRFDQALAALERAWRGEPVALAGTGFAGAHADAATRAGVLPLQRPHPPLAVAAFGPKALAQAARHGLPYLASPMETLDALCENYARHRAGLAEAGIEHPVVVPAMRTLYVADDDAQARRVLDALDREQRAMARMAGRTPAVLARAAAAPVAARAIVGTAADVADQLARYRERLALDLLVARTQVPGADDADRRRSLDRIVERVLPALSPSRPRA